MLIHSEERRSGLVCSLDTKMKKCDLDRKFNNKNIEVHYGLQTGACSANRGRDGGIKTMTVNGNSHGRWSSQAKKAPIRPAFTDTLNKQLAQIEITYRTRGIERIFEEKLKKEENSLYSEHAIEMATWLAVYCFNNDKKLEHKTDIDTTPQIIVATEYTIMDVLAGFMKIVKTEEDWTALLKEEPLPKDKESKKAEKAGDTAEEKEGKSKSKKKGALFNAMMSYIKSTMDGRKNGIEVSLFGAMQTNDVSRSVESAVFFNHSYTIAPLAYDTDFFTAMDNYLSKQESDEIAAQSQNGAAFMSDREFSCHVYYNYVAIDVGQFYRNMCCGFDMEDENVCEWIHDTVLAAIREFLKIVVVSTPSGSQHSFASFSDPVGVYATVRRGGMNRTADSSIMKFMNPYSSLTEQDRFVEAMKDFSENEWADVNNYMAKIYCGKDAEKISAAEHVTKWTDAVEKIVTLLDD